VIPPTWNLPSNSSEAIEGCPSIGETPWPSPIDLRAQLADCSSFAMSWIAKAHMINPKPTLTDSELVRIMSLAPSTPPIATAMRVGRIRP